MSSKHYKELIAPTLSWDQEVSSPTLGTLIVTPLEPGFGITIGNALRRVMLASIEGAAVTSVVIKGVNSEFSTIHGVVEDTLQIILNVKGIVVKNASGLPGKLRLSISGKSTVTCADIEADPHLEIVNKEHVIAHLADDGELVMEFAVENGRGYVPAQWPRGVPLQEDDRIYIDSSFSPVKKVDFLIEKTRVGEEIDFDKLILTVETNGAMHPQEVLHYATSVLRSLLERLLEAAEIPFNQLNKDITSTSISTEIEGGESSDGLRVDFLIKEIEGLEFSVRAHNCLKGAGIKRVFNLVNATEEELLKIKNFGRKSLREVKEILGAFNLRLGMKIKEVDLKKAALKEQGSLASLLLNLQKEGEAEGDETSSSSSAD